MDSEFINYIIRSAHTVKAGILKLNKTTKAVALIAVIVASVAVSIFTAGWLQNDNSSGSSQNSGIATYTGYLVEGHSCQAYGVNNSYPNSMSEEVSMTFADGRTFTANLALIMSRNVVINSTCTICYNVSEPTVAVDIVS